MNSRKDPRGCRGASSGDSRDLEAAAPPPRGPALPRQGPLLVAAHATGQEALSGTRLPQHHRAPSPRSVPGLGAPGSFPAAASAARSPSPASQDPPPYRPAGSDRQTPRPITVPTSRPCLQSASAEGGASPKSSRLLPGPQDPFCLGELGWD